MIRWNFPPEFFYIQVFSVIGYGMVVTIVAEWRVKLFRNEARTSNEYTQKATDSLLNYETVNYFNAHAHERVRFLSALEKYKEANILVTVSLGVINCVHSLVISFGLLLNLLLAVHMFTDGILTIGDVVMLITYILQIYDPMFYLGTYYKNFRMALTNVEQVFNLIDVNSEIKESENPEPCGIKKGQITFNNVSFSYTDNVDNILINKMNFNIPEGSSVAFVGSTGSGKTTINRLIYRLYDPLEGKIYIDGCNVADLKLKELRSKIAVVPQEVVLFNETLLYNLTYAIENKDELTENQLMKLVRSACKKAQLLSFIESLPEGFETKVGERGVRFSGGERQRVGIARALLKDSPIVIFDEATSALDSNTEDSLMDAIKNASKGKTTIMVAHRLSTIKHCDNIIVLKFGTIIDQGTHTELLERCEQYKSLWKYTKMEIEDKDE